MCRISCLGNVYRVSLCFGTGYEGLHRLLGVLDNSLSASVGGRFTDIQ
jgi:hypothetical protein